MRPAEAVANLASVKLITGVEVVVDHDHVAGEHGSGRGSQDGSLDIDHFAQAQVAEAALQAARAQYDRIQILHNEKAVSEAKVRVS